jgi:hypothetical protein
MRNIMIEKLFTLLAFVPLGTMQAETIFHLAMPASTLEGVQEFYEDLGGKRIDAREDAMAFDLYGHSVIFRLYEGFRLPDAPLEPAQLNEELALIPARHFREAEGYTKSLADSSRIIPHKQSGVMKM